MSEEGWMELKSSRTRENLTWGGGRCSAKEALLWKAQQLQKRVESLENLASFVKRLEDEEGAIPPCLDQALWEFAQNFR